ncbi:MAG: UDP-N-acetylmuramoyl-L-alanyl-D-glutamate--2,6-diaminopimelate ligase [Tepidisphaera sp.]|nr:UDP-N-acetylmuramoyl-L-alanyl-D-glutamate--2,6-diaminopimelate ligase [Tepidisphaera sp.]
MDLAELLRGMDVSGDVPAPGAVRVCDLTEDSRTVVPGSLFIARGGLKADGNRFVRAAVQAGAVAVLTDDPVLAREHALPGVPVLHAPDIALATALLGERFYGNPSSRVALMGVTGTNGKTTTTYLIWQLLNHAGVRCGLIGTVVVDDGVEVGPAAMTTPPALELSRSIGVMAEAGVRAAALEVSSHALDQKRADGLAIRVGVFTNLTGDHLDYHKTMEAYAGAKARLFELLPPTGLAVVNAADPASARMLRDCKSRVIACALLEPGTHAKASATCEILEMGLWGMRLRLSGPWGHIEPRVGLIGRYNAMNLLEAACAAHEMGVSAHDLLDACNELKAPPGRLESVSAPGDEISVFVDYAHSDDSLRNVLAEVGGQMPGRRHAGGRVWAAAGSAEGGGPAGRLWAVFGCGGDRDTSKRPRMGAAASELADVVIVTSDNPRTERPGDIIDQILAGITPANRAKVSVQADRARAIRHAIENAQPGDVVVVAGKGHETEQILPDGNGGTIRTHFDDREVARAALRERGGMARAGATT